MPFFPGLLPLLPAVALCPPDDILPLSSAATAPHLCLRRRGSCPVLPWSAFLQALSDAPPGHLNVEALPLSGDARLLPPHLLRDIEGARRLLGRTGTPDPLSCQLDASPPPPLTEVALFGGPLVPRDALIRPACPPPPSEDSSPLHTAVSSSVGCLVPQSRVKGDFRTSFHQMQI